MEGISQEQLAEKIGKSAHFISLIERGESGLSVATLIDICNALNTDTNSIFFLFWGDYNYTIFL